jgi:hypothetical protein
MPIVLGNTTITGLAAGGLPNGVIGTTSIANGAVTREKLIGSFSKNLIQVRYQIVNGRIAGANSSNYSTSTINSIQGSKFLEVSITPLSSTSTLFMSVNIPTFSETSNHSNYPSYGIWKDNTGSPLTIGSFQPRFQDTGQVPGGGSNHIIKLFMQYSEISGSTTARTYSFYAGWNAGAGVINGCGSENSYGGQMKSTMIVYEFAN